MRVREIILLSLLGTACSTAPVVTRPVDPLIAARNLTKAGKAGEAYRRFEAILKSEPANLTAHRGLVEAGYYAGRLEEVTRRYEGLTRRDDLAGLGHYGLALVRVARGPGHKQAALEAFSLAAKLMPKESDVPYRIGLIHLMDGSYRRAEEILRRARELAPDRPDVLVALGAALVRQGRDAEAIESMRRILALSPPPEVARKARAISARVFDPLDEVPPEVAQDLRRATDLIGQDAMQQALALVERVIAKHPQIAFAHALRGLSHSRLQNDGEAIVAFERSLELRPDSPVALVGLGDVYARLEKWGRARTYFERATQLDPFDVEAHQRMGDMATARHDPDRAAACYATMVLLAPDRIDFHHKWAKSLVTADQLAQAMAAYETILAKDADGMEALIRLGSVHLALARREPLRREHHHGRARDYLQRASELNPDNQMVQEMLSRLEE